MKRFLVALVLLLALAPTPAGAAEQLTIRKLDTSAFPEVRVSALFTGERPDLGDVSVRENGKLVNDIDVVPLAESTTPVGIVLVLDTSGSMQAGGRLQQAKQAARSFIERKLPNDQIALVTFANEPRVAVNFTADPGPLVGAIDALQPAGETALWDGVRVGSNLFAERPDLLPYLVVLSDGADTVSASSAGEAFGAARSAQAGVFSIAITGSGESDVPALRSLADETGGTFAETRDASQLGRIYADLQGLLQNQYEIVWTSAVQAQTLEVSVKVGTAVAAGSAAVNSVSLGTAAQPRPVAVPSTPAVLADNGPIVIAVLVGLVGACVGAGIVLFRRDGPSLEEVLQVYTGTPGVGPGGGLATTGDGGERSLVPESVRRAVERTAELTGGGGALEQLDRRLDAADLKVRAQEAVLFVVAGLFVFVVLGFALGGPLVALAFRSSVRWPRSPFSTSWAASGARSSPRSCPTRCSCWPARCGPATRCCRGSTQSPRRSTTRWAASSAASCSRPASAGTWSSASATWPPACRARTSTGSSWPSRSSARSAAT